MAAQQSGDKRVLIAAGEHNIAATSLRCDAETCRLHRRTSQMQVYIILAMMIGDQLFWI